MLSKALSRVVVARASTSCLTSSGTLRTLARSTISTWTTPPLLTATSSTTTAAASSSSSSSVAAPDSSFSSPSWVAEDKEYIVGLYARLPFHFVRGEKSTLYDSHDRPYLDFYSGIAVNSLGHSDPEWAQAVAEQAKV